MNVYATDHEQWELIKAWWKANGKMIVTVVILAMAATYAYRYWQQHQQQQGERASVLYEQMLSSQTTNSTAVMTAIAGNLENNYSKTPYASLASLLEAKIAADNANLAVAEQKLNWVIDHSKSKSLKQIARIRAARVLLAQNRPEDALKLLAVSDDSGFLAEVNQVKGDIYLAQGDKLRAYEFYQAALNTIPQNQPIRGLLQMQLDQLPKK